MYLMEVQGANAKMVTLAMEFYAQVNHIGSMFSQDLIMLG
jgi:hypothetical protein